MTPALTVIGAGPAGLAAATAAGEAGVATTLIDENEYLGGQYYRQPRGAAQAGAAGRPARAGASAIAALQDAGVDSMPGATAYAAAAGRIEVDHRAGRRTLSSAVLLACGATERVVPVPGWTLPGVVTGGAAQALLKMHGEPVGQRVLVAGSGPFLLPVAAALIGAGAKVPAVVEAQRLGRRAVAAACSSPAVMREAAGHLWALTSARSRLRTGWGVVRIDQRARGLCVEVARLDHTGAQLPGKTDSVDCDALCLSDGFIPSVGLAQLAGATLRFLPGPRTWAVGTDSPSGATGAERIWAAGACVTPWSGATLSSASGELAGRAAAAELGGSPSQRSRSSIGRSQSLARRLERAFPARAAWYQRTADEVTVCRCENVDAGTIREAATVSADLNAVKRMTRAGMGLCQGRTCQASVAELTAGTAGVPIESVGHFNARSPDRPTTLAALAGSKAG